MENIVIYLKEVFGDGLAWIVVGRYRENWFDGFRAVIRIRSS